MTRIDVPTSSGSEHASSGRVSDRALRVFVAAASSGTLTGAAEALGMGQPAVSHAISRLERAVGALLLSRSHSGVQPTQAGRELLTTIGPAYALIDEAVARARPLSDDDIVSLSVSTSLASWWLLPRLPEFKRNNPEVSLRLVTADSDAGVDLESLDLWIPLGLVDRPDLEATPLCNEVLIPVASPELAAQMNAEARRSPDTSRASTPSRAADLLEAPLLHLEERYAPRFDWHRWFDHHGVDTPTRLPGDRSNDYSLVIQAALDGQGVALGWRHIVSDLLDTGRLVPLSDPITTDQPFVVFSTTRRLSTGAAALRDWVADGCQNTGRRPLARNSVV